MPRDKILTALTVFILLAGVAVLFLIAWFSPEKEQSLQPQKTTIESNDIRREMQEETLPIGCWQSQYFENGTIFQLKFSQDGYYKEYYGNEPKENSGTWKRITADKIQLNGKIPDRILTMEKKGDEYIMKEIYNGNPREWKKEK